MSPNCFELLSVTATGPRLKEFGLEHHQAQKAHVADSLSSASLTSED